MRGESTICTEISGSGVATGTGNTREVLLGTRQAHPAAQKGRAEGGAGLAVKEGLDVPIVIMFLLITRVPLYVFDCPGLPEGNWLSLVADHGQEKKWNSSPADSR